MMVDTIAGRTLAWWEENAQHDDCFDSMVPSDLRQLIGTFKAQENQLEIAFDHIEFLLRKWGNCHPNDRDTIEEIEYFIASHTPEGK